MDQLGDLLSQYATKEVMTVFGVLVATFLGWKAAKGTWSLVAGISKKASFLGLAAATLFAAGLGATGFGVGEVFSRPGEKVAPALTPGSMLSNADLIRIIENDKHHSPETIKAVLEYAKDRDTRTSQKDDIAYKVRGDQIIPVRLNKEAIPQTIPETFQAGPYDHFTVDAVKEAADKAEESMLPKPLAYMLILLGFGTTITGATVFFTRHNSRSTSDPHHPNYEAQYARRTA